MAPETGLLQTDLGIFGAARAEWGGFGQQNEHHRIVGEKVSTEKDHSVG